MAPCKVHPSRVVLLVAALLAAPSIAAAQTTCAPGHKFTPQDHDAILQAVVRHAPEVIGKIRFDEVTMQNRAGQVLRAALAVPEIAANVKSCVDILLQQRPLPPDAVGRVEQRYPQARQLLDGVAHAMSLSALQEFLRHSGQEATQADVRTALQTAQQIIDRGKAVIYNSQFYANAAQRYGSPDPAAIGSGMALELAKSDAKDAIVGGLFGAFAGPEAIGPAACDEAIRSSVTTVVEIFVDLWFG